MSASDAQQLLDDPYVRAYLVTSALYWFSEQQRLEVLDILSLLVTKTPPPVVVFTSKMMLPFTTILAGEHSEAADTSPNVKDVGAVVPLAQKKPAGHFADGALNPADPQYWPPGQTRGEVVPTGQYEPGGHCPPAAPLGVGTFALPLQYHPVWQRPVTFVWAGDSQ